MKFLFSAKKGCTELSCSKYEQSLAAMRDEFESSLDAKVLKLESSQLQRIYDISKQDAALVFLRKGVGLLYPSDGIDTPDEIFDFFNDNREPIVKELDDASFEHLTQASSGSTTGDWLIQFYDNQCIDCNRLQATWETVGAKLKTRMNIARVNRGAKGILTSKRFKVERSPEFILLRPGKYYRYNLKQYDVETFVTFATTWYSRLTAEKVATPSTPFEEVLEYIVQRLKQLPNMKILSMNFINDNPLPVLVAISALFILFAIYIFKSKGKVPSKTGEAKKESKKE